MKNGKGDNLEELLEANVSYVTESQLVDYLTNAQPDFLTEKTDDAQFSTENVQRLVESVEPENWILALEFMKSGGVPKALQTDLLAIHRLADDTKIRAKAGRLLKKGANPELLLALKGAANFRKKGTSYYYYEFASDTFQFKKGGIDLLRFAYLLTRKFDNAKMASYLFVEGDSFYRRLTAEFLVRKMGNSQRIEIEGPGLSVELLEALKSSSVKSLAFQIYTGAFNPPRLEMKDVFPNDLSVLANLRRV